MKVLFIHFSQEFRPRTLLSLSILDTILRKAGHKTAIFDTSFYPELLDKCEFDTRSGAWEIVKDFKISPKQTSAYEDLKKKVEEFKPGLIGFTYYETHVKVQRKLLNQLKKDFPDLKIIAGGPQPCINPEKAIKEPYIDMICYGEGENLIKSLCEKMEKGEDISQIKGLWIKQKNRDNFEIVRNGIAPLTDLDTLPIVDWDSYDPIHIYGLFRGQAKRMGHVEFTRGCPFNCAYCGSGSIRKAYHKDGQPNFVRHKKPKLAVKELKALKEKYNLEMFYFVDGTFTAMPPKTLEEFSRLYRKHVNLPFIALVHPLTINKKVAKLLKNMNCTHTSMGLESGDEKYRAEVFNRHMSNDSIINAVKCLRNEGIHVSTYSMLGMPGMDRKHVFKTIKLNKDANPNSAIATIFIPFPDNELTMSCIKKGLIDPNKIEVTVGQVATVEIKDMTKKEIEGLHRTFHLYVKLPVWTYPLIRVLENSNPVTDALRKLLVKFT